MRNNQRRIDPVVVKEGRKRTIGQVGKLFAIGLLCMVTMTAGWWMNQRMTVNSWQIEADAALKEAINSQLNAMPNRDFLHTRLDQLDEQWMQAIPDMARIEIARILPDRLYIRAEARVPAAMWQDAQNRVHLFDDQGHAYRMLQSGESPDLPLLRVREEQLAAAHQLMQLLLQADSKRLAELSEVRAGSRNWQLYFSKGTTWKLPFGEEAAAIARISTLMNKPRWRNRHWQVDARLQTRWFIRPAKHGGVI